MPPMRTVAGILIDVCKEVRQNLRSARTGWVETSLDAIAARTEAAMHPGSRTGTDLVDRRSGPATGNLKSLFDSAALFGTAAFHNASDSASANGSRQSGKSENGSANDSNSSDERAYIRVATTRLDALMNLAGELVVSRSRMASRVGTLRFLYRELGRSRVRLTNTVETFRDQYEFANIGGKASRQSTRMTRTVEVTEVVSSMGELARTGSGGAGGSGAGGRAGGSEVFGELELDEYGDIHVLSRSLAEIGNDFEEAFRTLSSELSSFAEDADSLGGIISGIQGEVTRARMVPLDAVFTRLRFPVRDAATRDSKDVHVITEGGDVNIDKTIADAILQPMLHLVRNAVAHGIESPSRRASLGKDRVGTIKLVARQQSGQIVIEVNDDGAGLDLAALRARGIAQGLITTDVTIDDPRVKELVFASGLSTRELANDVAGRGVGGEVVKRTIERLNGAIRIETTRGKGTSFVIALPLTLAITRALLVSEGHATYAVPLYFAERIIDAESLNIVETGDERRVLLDGQFTRVRRLDEYFGGAGTGVKRGGPALVLRVGDERMVLQLDAVLGQEEIVVKRAGELLEGHPLFAGVTLRGTGDLVLIVDIPGLLAEFAKAHRPTDDVAGPTHPVPIEVMVEARPTPEPKKRADRSLPKPRAAAALVAPPQKRGADAAGAKAKGKAEGAAEPVAAPPRAVVAPPQALGGVRALVVDDSLSVRKVAEAHLRGLGVEVVVAVDGVDGLAKLREGTFDVIFTDLEMPRMHGYDFIRQLRLLAVYQDLPVVVVSSRSGQKHQDHARSVGATDYITKPFSAQSLEATIRKWLRG
jgi:chemosensory pili system protein ChpA (sensor histidine kinase/response regulator)